MAKASKGSKASKEPQNYNHSETHPQRPDIGTEPHETLKSHKVSGDQLSLFELFSDPQWSISDQILKAYEYHDKWIKLMLKTEGNMKIKFCVPFRTRSLLFPYRCIFFFLP